MKHCLVPTPPRARASVLGAAALLLLFAACQSGTEERDPLAGLAPAGQLKLQLTRADSCADLLTRIQDGLVVPLAERAKQLRNPATADHGVSGGGVVNIGSTPPLPSSAGPATPMGAVPPRDAAPVAQGSAPDANGNTAGAATPPSAGVPTQAADDGTAKGEAANPNAPSGSPPSGSASGAFSDTTVQVKDVDEADIVKTEGDRIYLLHGGTLFVLQGWPASSTSILGSSLVEGQPTEMFVRGGKAVVFSRVSIDPSQLPGAAPMAAGYGYYYGGGATKITVLDVATATPSVLRESYLEGDYISARRHDGLVRAVVQNGFKVPQLGSPYIEYVDAFGHPYPQADIDAQVDDWLERTARSIQSTEIGDWLPREYTKLDGRMVAEAPRCGDYYAPDPGLTETGVTSVVALDLDDVSAPFSGATILGRAERVYSNEQALLVTQTDYRYELVQGSSQQTILHRFDIDGKDTSYVASGAVAGTIHDQFSLDERQGVIRVSTTEQNFSVLQKPQPLPVDPTGAPVDRAPVRPANGLVNRVVTLGTDGDQLVQLGSTEDFGTSESIYSTRFIGDLGYVVTFRQTDPLFVVNLADPKHPAVVGELKVPGYSSYLFPMDDDHLFAIGQDATAQGTVQGLSLSIFDVSNPASPALAQRYTFPESGASPANIDHRAITFHQNGNVVAFPYQRYDTGVSTLEVFQLSVQDGFARLGGMAEQPDFDRCLADYYGYGYGYPAGDVALMAPAQTDPEWRAQVLAQCNWSRQFRRGLFRDDFVYGISNTGVYAYDLGAMAAGAVGQLSLPREVYDYSANGSAGGGSKGVGVTAPAMNVAPPKPVDASPQMADGAK